MWPKSHMTIIMTHPLYVIIIGFISRSLIIYHQYAEGHGFQYASMTNNYTKYPFSEKSSMDDNIVKDWNQTLPTSLKPPKSIA